MKRIKVGDRVHVSSRESQFHGVTFKVTNPERTHAYGSKPLIEATHPTHGQQLFHRWEITVV